MTTGRGVIRCMAALAFFAASTGASTLVQHGMIDGIVTDANLSPLPDASISILGSSLRVTTGANGRFRIVQMLPGRYLVAVHRLGYAPVSVMIDVAPDDTLRPSFSLNPIANALDTMVITGKSLSGRLSEFEERRRFGFGHFLTQDDIDKRLAVSVTDLLRPVPSIRIEGETVVSMREWPARNCPFVIYVDGVLLRGVALSQLPPPKDLAGVEIYSGASTIPMQYKTANSGCGVILIWTKDGSS